MEKDSEIPSALIPEGREPAVSRANASLEVSMDKLARGGIE